MTTQPFGLHNFKHQPAILEEDATNQGILAQTQKVNIYIVYISSTMFIIIHTASTDL